VTVSHKEEWIIPGSVARREFIQNNTEMFFGQTNPLQTKEGDIQ